MTAKDHGWTHLPGGTDPIPAASSSGDHANVRDYRCLGPALFNLYNVGQWNGTTADYVTVESTMPGSTATDTSANAPYGAYFELTGQNAYIGVAFPLAPRYSVWQFNPIFSAGPDCGIVTVEWQTVNAGFGTGKPGWNTSFNANSPLAQWANIPSSFTSDTSWYRSGSPISRYQVDCYSASAYVFDSDGSAGPNMYLDADPGTLVAANPTGSHYTDTHLWPGGADGSTWWWVRMKTKTKNASSSGYALRLHGYSMHRLAGDLSIPG